MKTRAITDKRSETTIETGRELFVTVLAICFGQYYCIFPCSTEVLRNSREKSRKRSGAFGLVQWNCMQNIVTKKTRLVLRLPPKNMLPHHISCSPLFW